MDDGVAEPAALDPEPLAAERRQVRAASDECDLLAADRKPAPEIAADPARAHDGDPHGQLPLSVPPLLMPACLPGMPCATRTSKLTSRAGQGPAPATHWPDPGDPNGLDRAPPKDEAGIRSATWIRA